MPPRSADRAAGARRRAFFAVAAGWASLALEPAAGARDDDASATPSAVARPETPPAPEGVAPPS